MALDPRIALGVQPLQVTSPLELAGKALSLRSLMDEQTLRALQRQQLTQAMAEKQERNMSLRQFAETLPEHERPALMLSPDTFIKERFAPYNLRPGEQRRVGDRVVAEAPHTPTMATVGVEGQPGATQTGWVRPGSTELTPVGAPKLPQAQQSELQKLLMERDQFPPGDQRRAIYDLKIRKLVTHQPAASTVVNVAGKEADKAYGKFVGEAFADIQKAGIAAPGDIARYQQLGNLLSQVNTGRFAGTALEVKRAAKGLGFDLNALGVRDDVPAAEAARALGNQMALELRNPAGGAGMPGAMSDKDREFLVSMIPNIENDPAAIPKMIDYRVRVAKRSQEVAKRAREYAARNNGNIDNGFFEELQRFSEANPLFPETPKGPARVAPTERRRGVFDQKTGSIQWQNQ